MATGTATARSLEQGVYLVVDAAELVSDFLAEGSPVRRAMFQNGLHLCVAEDSWDAVFNDEYLLTRVVDRLEVETRVDAVYRLRARRLLQVAQREYYEEHQAEACSRTPPGINFGTTALALWSNLPILSADEGLVGIGLALWQPAKLLEHLSRGAVGVPRWVWELGQDPGNLPTERRQRQIPVADLILALTTAAQGAGDSVDERLRELLAELAMLRSSGSGGIASVRVDLNAAVDIERVGVALRAASGTGSGGVSASPPGGLGVLSTEPTGGIPELNSVTCWRCHKSLALGNLDHCPECGTGSPPT